ncbi:disease resistance protein RUN1-like [Eucalyptus grandis]|uniref:disease resistance protein RUN1-like n=1 Tax=Eucalyptus grandis TaxID=71139 RepID=UPI00192EFA1E|nr:disease resistance protein RUN1-like [Eucalyptus grandis]
MEFCHALELFSRHAFRRDSPPDDYVYLSKKVVSTLGKLPLALEVTGSSLSGRSKEFWLDTLKKLEKAPSIEVQKTLMITYERLDDAQMQVFLDISCFFINEDKTYPCYMWEDCEYHPYNAIEILCLMSLMKIKDDNTFWMHDQVRDLGRAIIREENFKEPHKRSRVWNHQEALSILEQKKGSKKVEALSLGSRGVIIMPSEVANLRHLRFLEGNEMFLVGDFNNLLSNLRWLSWRWCPFEFVATNFHLVNLIVLDLSHSYVLEKWIGWNQIRVASKLKVLDLSNCNDLMRTPDLSMLVSLERLILEGCRNLIEIDPSIGKLKLLTTLNLNGCHALKRLPYEIGCLDALTEILMPRSLYAFKLPETIGNLKSLLTLDVSHSRIRVLPDSIGGLVKLRRLNLFKCLKIKKLPSSLPPSLSCLRWAFDTLKICKNMTYMLERDSAYHSSIVPLYEVEELASGKTRRFLPWHLSSSLREFEVGNLSITPRWDYSHLSNLSTLRLQSCSIENFLDVLPEEVKRSILSEQVKIMQLEKEQRESVMSEMKRWSVLKMSRSFLLQMKRLRHLEMRMCKFSSRAKFSSIALRLSHMKILEEFHGKDVKPIEIEKAKEAKSRRMSKVKKRGRSKSLGIFTEVVDSQLLLVGDYCDFWVKFIGLPYGRVSYAVIEELASKLGVVVEVKLEAKGSSTYKRTERYGLNLNMNDCPIIAIPVDELAITPRSVPKYRIENRGWNVTYPARCGDWCAEVKELSPYGKIFYGKAGTPTKKWR